MTLELRSDFTYALLVPTSMGVRLTPVGGQPVHCSDTFIMQATSAESNVASVSSYLGLPVKVMTTFVKDSVIARFIKDDLASRHMDCEGREVEPGGPWGYRHQINIADSGCGSRGPRVQNDRAGEVGLPECFGLRHDASHRLRSTRGRRADLEYLGRERTGQAMRDQGNDLLH